MLDFIVTKHASKRLRERLGIKKRAQRRFIKKVFKCGKVLQHRGLEKHINYLEGTFIFSVFGQSVSLITCFKEEPSKRADRRALHKKKMHLLRK